MMARTLLILVFALILPFAAQAQDEARKQEEQNAVQEDVAEGKGERLALARKMHDIRPAYLQVEEAMNIIVQQLPEDKRELFVKKLREVMDYEVLTNASVQAMAETFTAAELEKMIDYFGSEEAKSIADKLPVYQAIIQPEITKMLDEALMDIRVGAETDSE